MSELFDPQSLSDVLRIKVVPKAKSARIVKGIDASGAIYYKVYVTVVPKDGKANQAVIKLLAKALGVAKSSLEITHGLTSRDKTIKIHN